MGELVIEDNDGVSRRMQLTSMPIGEDFVQVMGLKVVQGRDFSQRFLTDVGTNLLVNEALVRKMGWTEPLGKHMQIDRTAGRVIGVVQDFNFKSLHTLIEPLVMAPLNDDLSGTPVIFRVFQQRLLVVNISGDDVGDTLGYIEKVMAQADPTAPVRVRVPRRHAEQALPVRDSPHEADRHLRRRLHLHCLPRAVRSGDVHHGAADARDRHAQGAGRDDVADHRACSPVASWCSW